jgi:hypothetical protein
MSEKDGGQAFPQNQHGTPKDGMTLRDYFAAQAIQGLLASGEACPCFEMTANAYRIADAMLQAREAK